MKKNFLFFLLFFGILVLCSNSNKPITVFMVGDSTMADKPIRALPENGWGMDLGEFLKSNVIVQNYAANGRSSKSFIKEGRWDSVCNKISEGDFVIIQFGHNDQKYKDSTRYTIPQTTYKDNLRKYVNDSRQKGGSPIFCTSIVRRHFGTKGKLVDTHGDYPQSMREVAREMNVPIVDLQKLTENKINKLGAEKSKKLFMILKAGEYPNYKDGRTDSTHLSIVGAKIVAKLFVQDAKKQKLSFVNLMK